MGPVIFEFEFISQYMSPQLLFGITVIKHTQLPVVRTRHMYMLKLIHVATEKNHSDIATNYNSHYSIHTADFPTTSRKKKPQQQPTNQPWPLLQTTRWQGVLLLPLVLVPWWTVENWRGQGSTTKVLCSTTIVVCWNIEQKIASVTSVLVNSRSYLPWKPMRNTLPRANLKSGRSNEQRKEQKKKSRTGNRRQFGAFSKRRARRSQCQGWLLVEGNLWCCTMKTTVSHTGYTSTKHFIFFVWLLFIDLIYFPLWNAFEGQWSRSGFRVTRNISCIFAFLTMERCIVAASALVPNIFVMFLLTRKGCFPTASQYQCYHGFVVFSWATRLCVPHCICVATAV